MIVILTLLILLVFLWAYGTNIVYLSKSKSFSGMDALRVIGIIFPVVGIILGFIKYEENVNA